MSKPVHHLTASAELDNALRSVSHRKSPLTSEELSSKMSQLARAILKRCEQILVVHPFQNLTKGIEILQTIDHFANQKKDNLDALNARRESFLEKKHERKPIKKTLSSEAMQRNYVGARLLSSNAEKELTDKSEISEEILNIVAAIEELANAALHLGKPEDMNLELISVGDTLKKTYVYEKPPYYFGAAIKDDWIALGTEEIIP